MEVEMCLYKGALGLIWTENPTYSIKKVNHMIPLMQAFFLKAKSLQQFST